MTKEIKDEDKKETEVKETPAPKNLSKQVTSSKTIDFPSFQWGIHEGEIRELPEDEEAQKVILSNAYITKI